MTHPPAYRPSTDLHERFHGPCILIGSGPSQSQLDDLPEWRDWFSISCNLAQLAYPSPLYAFQDADFPKQTKGRTEVLPPAYGLLLTRHTVPYFLPPPTWQGWRVRTRIGPTDWLTSSEIHCPAWNTGALVAIFAHLCGFSPVVCVGFDATPNNYRYATNHPRYGAENPHAARKHAGGQQKFLREYAQRLGLINCSTGDWAERQQLPALLAQHQPNGADIRGRLADLRG